MLDRIAVVLSRGYLLRRQTSFDQRLRLGRYDVCVHDNQHISHDGSLLDAYLDGALLVSFVRLWGFTALHCALTAKGP
jgi:hypothetical protein